VHPSSSDEADVQNLKLTEHGDILVYSTEEGKIQTYHWTTKRLWHKLLEVGRMPVKYRLLVVQAWGTDG